MLGRRDPQRSLFDANCLPHRVAPNSFYGRMAAVCALLFQDDDLKELYDPSHGRPSLPPSLMSGALLLQFYDDVSDQEAAERVLYDLRWKIALHLPLDHACFDPSSLSYLRKRLAEHGQERYAFKRELCEMCRLFARCVHGKVQGRTITTDDYELHRQVARQRQETSEFRELYRKRSRVERKQAEMVRHGLRHTRYVSRAKRSLQRLWTAAVVNLKRLFRRAERRNSELRLLLAPTG